MENIRDKLIGMLGDDFGDSIEEKAKADPAAQLFFNHDSGPGAGVTDYLDSLDRVEFVMEIEEVFDISIPDEISSGFKSIDDIAAYVDTMTRGALHGGH